MTFTAAVALYTSQLWYRMVLPERKKKYTRVFLSIRHFTAAQRRMYCALLLLYMLIGRYDETHWGSLYESQK